MKKRFIFSSVCALVLLIGLCAMKFGFKINVASLSNLVIFSLSPLMIFFCAIAYKNVKKQQIKGGAKIKKTPLKCISWSVIVLFLVSVENMVMAFNSFIDDKNEQYIINDGFGIGIWGCILFVTSILIAILEKRQYKNNTKNY